jgi:hypothetical protein
VSLVEDAEVPAGNRLADRPTDSLARRRPARAARACRPAGHACWARRQGTSDRGLNMHRSRRGFAVEMRRAVSLEAASQALGPLRPLYDDAPLRSLGRRRARQRFRGARGRSRTPLKIVPWHPPQTAWLRGSWRRRESNPREIPPVPCRRSHEAARADRGSESGGRSVRNSVAPQVRRPNGTRPDRPLAPRLPGP